MEKKALTMEELPGKYTDIYLLSIHLINHHLFYIFIIVNLCKYLPVCLNVYDVHAVPKEARKGHWNWSCRQL